MHVECAFLDSEVVAIVLRPAPRKGCMRSGEGGLLCFPTRFNAFACICEQQQLCRQPVPISNRCVELLWKLQTSHGEMFWKLTMSSVHASHFRREGLPSGHLNMENLFCDFRLHVAHQPLTPLTFMYKDVWGGGFSIRF